MNRLYRMYHSHFGLREEPSGALPHPRLFFQTGKHREGVATLVSGHTAAPRLRHPGWPRWLRPFFRSTYE
jgi:hypothetical protein